MRAGVSKRVREDFGAGSPGVLTRKTNRRCSGQGKIVPTTEWEVRQSNREGDSPKGTSERGCGFEKKEAKKKVEEERLFQVYASLRV